jgi:hypothetical protein
MRKLLILAAMVAMSTACASRSEDESDVAPDQGDATVTATDTASVPTDSTMGQRPSATDTSMVRQEDTTSMSIPEPTQGDSALTNQANPAGSETGAMSDSTHMGHDSTAVQGDSAMTNSTVPDTTARQ